MLKKLNNSKKNFQTKKTTLICGVPLAGFALHKPSHINDKQTKTKTVLKHDIIFFPKNFDFIFLSLFLLFFFFAFLFF